MLVAGSLVPSPAEPIAPGGTVGDGEPHAATARTRAASAVTRATTGLRGVARAVAHRARIHRAHQLEVVVVQVGERRDRRARGAFELVRLGDDDRTGRLQPLELALDVLGLDVPDQPPRGRVLALDLGVGPDRHEALAE